MGLSVKAQAELVRRLGDRTWRLNNLYHQVDVYGKSYLFKPNRPQRVVMAMPHPKELILKARQLGFTTLSCIEGLDYALFMPDFATVIIAHKREDAERFMEEKIRYAWNSLEPDIQKLTPLKKDEGGLMRWEKGSSIRCTTSSRSGTPQFLHISEFGKLCAEYPDRAKEVVTGSLQSVAAGQHVRIESTAEGESGYFWQYCMTALSHQRMKQPMTSMDWRLFFFPWYEEARYVLRLEPGQALTFPEYLTKYFDKLDKERGIKLTVPQRNWYLKKVEEIQLSHGGVESWGDMKKEYPSFEEEAFEQSVEGAYYSRQFEYLEREGHICKVPLVPNIPVDTWWDIGGDGTAIWFTQDLPTRNHVLYCLIGQGESLPYYVNKLRQLSDEKKWVLGINHVPHDADQTDWATGKTKLQQIQTLGLRAMGLPRTDVDIGIEAVRNLLPTCWFDQEGCVDGLKALKAYRKQWDEKMGKFRDKPLHDWASHPADGFRLYAMGRDIGPRMRSSAPPPPVVTPKLWS